MNNHWPGHRWLIPVLSVTYAGIIIFCNMKKYFVSLASCGYMVFNRIIIIIRKKNIINKLAYTVPQF